MWPDRSQYGPNTVPIRSQYESHDPDVTPDLVPYILVEEEIL